mgnify:CR=1 FL=1
MTIERNSRESLALDLLRFPLAALVVLLNFEGFKDNQPSMWGASLVVHWGETSFFIYAFGNTLILWFVNKNVGYMLETIPYIGSFLNYEFLFVARVVECVIVYYVMRRYTPRLLTILIGGRIK